MVGLPSLLTLCVILASATLQDARCQLSVIPTDVVVNVTESVTVQCSHSNSSVIISWQKDSLVLSNSTPGFNISGSGEELLTIISANPDRHSGNYTCVAGAEMAAFTITVQFIGAVSVQITIEECAQGVVYLNSKVILNCEVADSVPTLLPSATEWFRDDDNPVLITEGSSDRILLNGTRLLIQNIISTDSADYFCRASNGPITKRSSGTENVAVRTKAPLRIMELSFQGVTQSRDAVVVVKEGERTTLNCFITPPFPTFTPDDVSWSRNTADIVSNRNGVVLFSSPRQPCNFTLIIASTGTNNQGTYRCHLEESPGVIITTSLTIKLGRIPQRYNLTTTPPNTPLLGVDRNISFHCVSLLDLTANVQETIRWEFVSAADGTTVDVVGDGERVLLGERTLTITSLRVSDSGTYVCVADDVLVDPVRVPVNLTVEDAFQVFVSPSSPMVRLGTSLALSCSIQSLRPANFSWAINGTTVATIVPCKRLCVTSNSSHSNLRITSLVSSDLTTISCVASDPLHLPLIASAVVTETDQLYLLGDINQKMLNVPNGSLLRLECPIRARSESTAVRWFAGNKELKDGMDGVQLRTLESGSSVVMFDQQATLEQDDGDEYLCEVTAAKNADPLMYRITLYITIAGNITSFPPEPFTATLGRRAQLDCIASGRPPPRIMWFHGPRNLSEQTNPTIMDIGNGSLVFENVAEEDAGSYTCLITSPTVTRSTVLQVEPDDNPVSDNVLGLNRDEAILVFVMVGVVSFSLLLMLIFVFMLCCRYLMERVSQGKYMINQPGHFGSEAGSLKHNSLKARRGDNSDILMSTPVPIFTTLQRSTEEEGFVDPMERHVPLEDVTPRTFHAGSESLLTESQQSSPRRGTMVPTPSMSSPLHGGTEASTSLYNEEHSMENGLPNFPRMNVRLKELMGQGEFGPVMKAVAKDLVPGEPETEVAVKLLVTEAVEDTGFRADLAVADYASHMKLRYGSIAAILGICSDKEPYLVMYEYLDKGDLKRFLLSSRPEPGAPPKLMDHELMRMIGQVADGMAYLFSQRIIHGDIATRNCLVSSALEVKIGDLGIGHELYTGDYYDNGAQLLPIRWMPPELLVESEEGPSFSLYSDTWSFGVFCWEVMAYGKLPYGNYSDEEVLAMIPAGSRLRSPSTTCPPALYLVIMECWEDVPEVRPQFNRILSTLATINLEDM